MVDVLGIQRLDNRLTDRCNCCTSEQAANAEWCARESLAKVLYCENLQFQSIFDKYRKIFFFSTSISSGGDGGIEMAIDSRETFGVTVLFMGYELFSCPVLVGGKMYMLIRSGITRDIDLKTWNSFQWIPPACLFCKTDLVPTSIVVKGKLYTLGLIVWTNYQRVLYTKKHKGFIMYSNNSGNPSPMTATEFPILNDFTSMQQWLPTSIGNRKIFHGGYVFTEMLKQTLIDVENLYKLEKRDVYIKQLIRTQTKRINTGCIDAVIGKNTVFNLPENETSSTTFKNYTTNSIGRYKILHKLDFTAISKCLQIDILTTRFSRRIPINLQRGDVGYVCLVSNSEQSPGTTNLELVLGCLVSTPADCVSGDIIESFLGLHVQLSLVPRASSDNQLEEEEEEEEDSWWYLIINQSLFKHLKQPVDISDWVACLRYSVKKVLAPCIEVYQISKRFYVIYSFPLTLYKPFHDGLVYSSMEVSTTDSLYVNIIAEHFNLHGPSAMLIPNLNSNHLIRNTMAVHAIKNCVSGIPSTLLKNETYLLNKSKLIPGVPFYVIKANILIFPLSHNIEDACAISARSAHEKKLFTLCKKSTSTLHLENPTVLKKLIKHFPTSLKPNMVFMKFKAEKTFHVGKNLSITSDIFEEDISNVIWTPNTDVIRADHYLKCIKISRDKNGNYYCDFEVEYTQDGDVGMKMFFLNSTQKTVVAVEFGEDEMPLLHNTPSIDDVANVDIDIIQHPFSLKRLSMNFLFTPEFFTIYNDCFSLSAVEKLFSLRGKKDYYVSNKKTGRFYVDADGYPVQAILYEGYVLVMGKQNPYAFLHCANIDHTPLNSLTGQPEIRYQTSNFLNKNNHCFGLSESEREVCVALGLNSFLEEMHDLSDETHLMLENYKGHQVCIPSSKSTARVLDMLSLAGAEVDFLIKTELETEF